MHSKKGVVLTMVLFFVIILSTLTGIAILLMSNQARITEAQVRRIRAFYTAQAGIVEALQGLRANPAATGPWSVPLNGLIVDVTVEPAGAGTGPNGTRRLTAVVNY